MKNITTATAIPFDFDGHEVRTIATSSGEALFVASDVAEALGYKEPHKAVSRHCKGGTIHPTPTASGIQEMLVIREPDVYRLVVKSRLPSADRFEQWVFEDVLPTIRRTGRYGDVQQTQSSIPELIQGAGAFMDALRIEGSSRIQSMKAFAASNCPQYLPMLPDYAIDAPLIAGGAVSSLATESATALLGKCDAGMGAARFNRLCEAAGILEKKSRKKKTGGMKSFWCVTEKGLDYGKNVTSEHSPLETQPHWYCDHFDALLALVEQEKAA